MLLPNYQLHVLNLDMKSYIKNWNTKSKKGNQIANLKGFPRKRNWSRGFEVAQIQGLYCIVLFIKPTKAAFKSNCRVLVIAISQLSSAVWHNLNFFLL